MKKNKKILADKLKMEKEKVAGANKVVKNLLYNHKKLMKKYLRISPYRNKLVFLLRNTMDIEVHEPSFKNKINRGYFCYTHSDGRNKEVELPTGSGYTLNQLGADCKLWLQPEDSPQPIPFNALTLIAKYDNTIQNAMSSEMKWRTEAKKADAKLILAWAGLIAVPIVLYVLYKVIVPSAPEVTKEIVTYVANTTQGLPLT